MISTLAASFNLWRSWFKSTIYSILLFTISMTTVSTTTETIFAREEGLRRRCRGLVCNRCRRQLNIQVGTWGTDQRAWFGKRGALWI
ncbi:hypothetical protein BJ742DRAFT_793563 [Cladochytrium replicatum]|nr:hypothetical protein BJ742DRAFT_793563 [Cladochytrium replicatum]